VDTERMRVILLVMDSALSFLQCFGTVGWVTGEGYLACKKPIPLISKGSVPEHVDEETEGGPASADDWETSC